MAWIQWYEVPIAPLRWLERTRGRWRLALLLLYGLVAGVVGLLIWRETVLWEPPDSPEPFDLLQPGLGDRRDAEDAQVLYQRAVNLLTIDPRIVPRGSLIHRVGRNWDWSQADRSVRSLVEANSAALVAWAIASDGPASCLGRFDRDGMAAPASNFNDLHILVCLATLEATRRQAAGDLTGAWAYLRSVVRAAAHISHSGGMGCASLEAQIIGAVISQLRDWVDDPIVTPELLRQAVGDLAACRRIQSALTDTLRREYLQVREVLKHPDEWQTFPGPYSPPTPWEAALVWSKDFLRNEPKRSGKISRLLCAGQLAQLDRPAAHRPTVVSPRYLIFARDAATPPSLLRITPARLAAWAEASACRKVVPNFDFLLGPIQAARTSFDLLRRDLAERSYTLDHAGSPPRAYGDLVPTYLDALPADVTATDLLKAL